MTLNTTLFLSTIIILLTHLRVQGQQFLLFQKNWHQHAKYYTGDKVAFSLEGDDTRYSGTIRGFNDSLILFSHYNVNPDKITHLYVDEKTKVFYIMKYKYEKLFKTLGIGYAGIDLINQKSLSLKVLVVGGSLYTLGMLAKLLVNDGIKIQGERKLKIVDIEVPNLENEY